MSVHIIYTFHKVSSITKHAMFRTRSNMGVLATKGHVHVTPKPDRNSNLIRDVVPIQIIFNSHKDPIKQEGPRFL